MGRLKKGRGQIQKMTNRSKWPPTFKLGWFTCMKIKLEEAAINNVVLRIPLTACTKPEVKQKQQYPVKKQSNSLPGVNSKSASPKKAQRSVSPKKLPTPKEVHKEKTVKPTDKNKRKSVISNGQNSPPRQYINKKKKSQDEEDFKAEHTQYLNGSHKYKSKLTVDFAALSDSVCMMKLPTSWRVTVMMNQDFTTVYQFVNDKLNTIKCVTFSQVDPDCNIVMNGSPVFLLGCPRTVDSVRDIEILLEIVDRLDLHDCMITKS